MSANQKIKSSFVYGFKKEAEGQSINLRIALGFETHSHLPAFQLAEHLGVKIITPNEIPGLSKQHLNNLLAKKTKGSWSAATIQHEDGSKIVIHNTSHDLTRQESNVMHELAHIIRGHEMKIVGNGNGLRDYNDAQENEAIWLGGCLQIPRAALIWAVKRNMKIDEIANHYKASKQMVTYRINKEGIKQQFRNWSG